MHNVSRRLGGWAYLAVLMLVLSACSPPEPGRVVTDLAFDRDGGVVEIDVNDESSHSGEPTTLTAVGRASEVCMDGGTCIRLVDERRIEESTDNWVTSSVVWEISPGSTWWRHRYDDGFNPVVIGVFDIIMAPDQSVVVAAGQLPLIVRSSEGEWSPTVGDLRELPGPSLLGVVLGGYVLLLAGFEAWRRHDDTIVFTASWLVWPHLALSALYTLVAPTGLAVLLLSLLLAPLLIVSFGLFAGAIRRERSDPSIASEGSLSATLVPMLGPSVCWVLVTLALYQLWSAGHARFDLVGLIWIVSFLIMAVGMNRQGGSGSASAAPALGSTIVVGIVVAYGAVIAILFSSARFNNQVILAVLPTATVLIAISIIARRTARLSAPGVASPEARPPSP